MIVMQDEAEPKESDQMLKSEFESNYHITSNLDIINFFGT